MKKNVIMVTATSATSANANEVMNQAVSSAASLAAAVEANQAEQDILSKAPYYSKDANGNLFILRGADMLKSAENICKARRVYAMPVPEGMEITKELGGYKLRKDGKESVLDTWVLTSAGTARYAQPISQGWSSWGWMSEALSRTDVMGVWISFRGQQATSTMPTTPRATAFATARTLMATRSLSSMRLNLN